MIVTVDKNELVIRVPIGTPIVSKTGKTLVVASSGGFAATTAQVDGKPVKVNLTAIVSR